MATITSNVVPFTIERAVDRAQGSRDHQEDDYALFDCEFPTKGRALFAVFDGHGSSHYSMHAKQHFWDYLEQDEYFKNHDYIRALQNAFLKENKAMEEIFVDNGKKGGTTATISLITDNALYLANVGDSRAVLGEKREDGTYKARRISKDHSLSVKDEKDRIENAGGTVVGSRVKEGGHGINMSRALGDFDFKSPFNKAEEDFISPVPTVTKVELIPSVDFVVLASDGLWSQLEDQEVVDKVGKLRDEGKSIQEIVSMLVERLSTSPKSDNITIMLIYFLWNGNSSTILTQILTVAEKHHLEDEESAVKRPKIEVVDELTNDNLEKQNK